MDSTQGRAPGHRWPIDLTQCISRNDLLPGFCPRRAVPAAFDFRRPL